MNMKEKNAKKSKIHQLGFCFLKRESNYLDRQRQAILVCFSVMLSLGILSNILGFLEPLIRFLPCLTSFF